jgi:cell division protein FtsI/penicillin-binding protein 2
MRGGVAFHRELLTLFGLDRVPSLGLPVNMKRDSLGMPAPIRGSLPNKYQFKEPSPYHRFTGPSLSMGYQYLIYPLTFGEAFCTVLTGREFRFRLVSSLEDVSGERIDLPKAGPGKRVFRPEVVRWIRDTLLRVISPDGTGRSIAGPGVTGVIGGKTGTSFRRVGGERSYTASFAGFAPGKDPHFFAFALLQKKPAYKFYGGKYAAPAVRDLLLAALEQEGGAEEFPQEKGEEDGLDVRLR